MFKLKWVDFHHVCNLFLVGNDRSISKHQNIQENKFCKFSNSVLGATSSPAHLFAIRGRRKRGPGTLQTRD